MPFDFNGMKVMVTVAGKGIGQGVAIALSKGSCKVYALSRTKSTLNTLVEEYPKIVPIVADLSDWEDTRGKLEQLEMLDCLVDNAGIIAIDYPALDCPKDFIYKVLDNNLLSAINCTQVIAKKMIAANVKGSIVNVSSVASLISFQNFLPYSISKAALNVMSKQFALELGPNGIRVNTVNPGLVFTSMAQEVLDKGIPIDKQFASSAAIGRALELREIVDRILYLLDDHSSMVTGQNHVVDGGITSCFKVTSK